MRKAWNRVVADVKTYYIGIVLFLIFNIVIRKLFHAFCPFLITTGFPCAGCGMTRAVYHILTGSFERGMNLNPAAPLWIGWIAYFLMCRYILGKNTKWVMRFLVLVCVVTFVIYLYRMMTQFPGDPPMTYYRNNILSKYLIIFKEMLNKGV